MRLYTIVITANLKSNDISYKAAFLIVKKKNNFKNVMPSLWNVNAFQGRIADQI